MLGDEILVTVAPLFVTKQAKAVTEENAIPAKPYHRKHFTEYTFKKNGWHLCHPGGDLFINSYKPEQSVPN